MRFSNSAVIAWFATMALALGAGGALAQKGTPSRVVLVDRIVAVVNSEVITSGEVAERVDSVTKQLRLQKTPLPPADLLQKQVLERMIMDRLQLQLAKETALRVDDLQLDRTVARVAEANKMSLTQFRQVLERDGIQFDKFREELRKEILISRLREREVDNRIMVTDNEIDYFLSQQGASPNASTEFKLSHIVLRLPEQASPEQVDRQRARAEQVLAQVREGVDFSKLAVGFSDAPDALQGGVMGWRARDRLPDLFVRAIDGLKPGEVSGIIRSPAGFHLMQVLERRKTDVSGERKRQEARLILRERKADEAYEEWLRQLRDRAFVEYRSDER